MLPHTFEFRVRYGETDQMGVVYHGAYPAYFEMGRTEWLRNLGVTYRWMEEHDVMLPVVDLSIRYKQPARYDDRLVLTTELRENPSYKITFDYTLKNTSEEVLATASTTLVFKSAVNNKLIRVPDYITERLKA
ncbi:acyl-CoA thioesterase [Gilvibacter sediminis]|uniref:acyl-CoA thioesterase n=1 Tax=Gilvibacter sediminis TaxID=379071 RepID=UPI00235095FB|nr:thioesterase family protein [Gilvibacter sediminis]MDC7997833.1 thioesterase family protein [Gilvibacter sediminis]